MKRFSLILAAFIIFAGFGGRAFAASPEPVPSPVPTPEPTPEPTVPPPSIFDIMTTAEPTGSAWQVDMAAYYLDEMLAAAAIGDAEAGHEAEDGRNAAIDAAESGEQKISFDDLYLLARVIYSEAGSDWLDEEFRLCVGEVVLNRVASPEFPDTIYDVVYQKGQYSGVNSQKFALLQPGEDCVSCALKLLQGERRMVPAVVYQSGSIQGEIFSMYPDRHLGSTYFCLSQNLDLYD